MTKMIVLRGLPGAGKTTYAKAYQEEYPETVRVNRDSLRDMMYDGRWTKAREDLVRETENFIVQLALADDRDVIVDDTNLDPEVYFRWQELVENYNRATVQPVKLVTKDFHTSVKQCKINNAKRTGRARVSDEVIDRFYEKYLKNEKK